MVIKKPTNPEPSGSSVDLREQLVRKSLEVNPKLRGTAERDTNEVLQDLKAEAAGLARAGKAAAQKGSAPARAPATLADKRKNAIASFMDQKIAEHAELSADIAERERALQDEKKALRERLTQELADFLAIVGTGPQSPEAKSVLSQHRAFLTQLGISDADLVSR